MNIVEKIFKIQFSSYSPNTSKTAFFKKRKISFSFFTSKERLKTQALMWDNRLWKNRTHCWQCSVCCAPRESALLCSWPPSHFGLCRLSSQPVFTEIASETEEHFCCQNSTVYIMSPLKKMWVICSCFIDSYLWANAARTNIAPCTLQDWTETLFTISIINKLGGINY